MTVGAEFWMLRHGDRGLDPIVRRYSISHYFCDDGTIGTFQHGEFRELPLGPSPEPAGLPGMVLRTSMRWNASALGTT